MASRPTSSTGGNARLRREIANLERNLREATASYMGCSQQLYEVYCAGMGIDPVEDEFLPPDVDGPAATVRRRIEELQRAAKVLL